MKQIVQRKHKPIAHAAKPKAMPSGSHGSIAHSQGTTHQGRNKHGGGYNRVKKQKAGANPSMYDWF